MGSPIVVLAALVAALLPAPARSADEVEARAVAENGGVVMLNFGGIFLDPAKDTT